MEHKEYQDITLFDFEKLCREKDFKQHTYLTVEQEHDSAMHTIVLCYTGKVMSIQYSPGQIVFLGADGELRFERVKYIRVYHNSSGLCLRYGIICGSLHRKSESIEYRLTAF